MANNEKETAILVPNPQIEQRSFASLSVRPLRLAFLIDTNATTENLLECITYNTSIWGGLTNFFVPVNNLTVSDEWLNSLKQFDPDQLIFYNINDEEFIRKIQNQFQTFFLSVWENNVQDNKLEWIENISHFGDPQGSVSMNLVLLNIFDEIRPVKQSRIQVLTCKEKSSFSFCAFAQFGSASNFLNNLYLKLFKARQVKLQNDSLNSYLGVNKEFSSGTSLLLMTTPFSSIKTMGEIWGPSIVLIDTNSPVESFCVFWNLRATSTRGVFILPVDLFDVEINIQDLCSWLAVEVNWSDRVNLVSANLSQDKLKGIAEKLEFYLRKKINIYWDNFTFGSFENKESEVKAEVLFKGKELNLRVPKPKWIEKAHGNIAWVIDINLDDPVQVTNGYLLPKGKLNYQEKRFRQNNEGFTLKVNKDTDFENITLPNKEVFLINLLKNKGYKKIEKTDKCRYVHGITRLLGTNEKVNLLQDPGIRALFENMKNGKARTISEMTQFYCKNKGLKTNKFNLIIEELALKGMMLRGYKIRCPACDLPRWYSLKEIAEVISCAGCLSQIQIPIDAPFQYKLNELISRGVGQGSIPVLLTSSILSKLCSKSFFSVPGMEIQKGTEKIDLDIIASCDGYLVLAECKTLQTGSVPEEIFSQFSDILKIALDIEAKIVILGLLLDKIPDEFTVKLDELRNQYKSEVTVQVVYRQDLERGYLVTNHPAGNNLSDIQIPMGIEQLLPKKTPKLFGRLIPEGTHSIWG